MFTCSPFTMNKSFFSLFTHADCTRHTVRPLAERYTVAQLCTTHCTHTVLTVLITVLWVHWASDCTHCEFDRLGEPDYSRIDRSPEAMGTGELVKRVIRPAATFVDLHKNPDHQGLMHFMTYWRGLSLDRVESWFVETSDFESIATCNLQVHYTWARYWQYFL